jgi:hypothetical protein
VSALGLAGALTAVFWPSSMAAPYDPLIMARQYVAFTACLLTGPAGLDDAQARAVWAGMEGASAATRAKVTYLAVVGAAETVGSVTPFANSLVQQHCGLVLAVGTVEVQTTQEVAVANTGVDFVLVGGGSPARNVAVVPAGSTAQTTSRVSTEVEGAVGGTFHAGVVP